MNQNIVNNDGNDHIDDVWALLLENLPDESPLETLIECDESSDRDLHSKRAKLFSSSHDFHFATAMPSGADNLISAVGNISSLGHRSNDVKGKETCTHIFSWNSFCDESSSSSARMLDDRDENGGSEMEDLEVQMDLTGDLLHMVFSFLDYVNLCRAAMVCRQWRAASAHEEFWRCLNFEKKNISLNRFQDMCWRYPNATQVNVYGVPDMHLLAMEAVSSLRNLESLTLGRGQLGDAFPFALADCSMLRSLNVYDAVLGSGIQEIIIDHDRLHHLQLSKCRLSRISVGCMQLKTLSLKRSTMTHAALSCPLLHLLDIGSCHKLSDAAIRSAVTSCPQLESLDISNCSCVTDETLREITSTCTSLRSLDASYCPNISLELFVLSRLTVLKLHSCEGITSASMSAINSCSMLEIVELDNCNFLTSVSLNLPRLQNIRLVHCRKLLDLDLQAAMLSSIMVSNCPALRGIHITSDCLQKLSLPKQENLVILELQCRCLQEVDLTDCESLSDSILEMFSDGGGCPKLKSLVLDDCEGLTSVKFSSSSLVSLSLVGCRKVTDLELKCCCLEEVYLDGCDHLETASFCPVALQSLNLGICPKLKVLNIEAQQMVSLELKGCGTLSRASICCPLLKSLDASFCGLLTNECLCATTRSCPLIESLVLMSFLSLDVDGLYSLHCLPHLTVLDLSYTFLTNLKPVFESCLQLKVLKLQACKYLTDTSLEPLYKEDALPMLQELDLSYGSFCQSLIAELLSYCTQLTHVTLNGCVNMHDLDWGSGSKEPYKWTAICGSSSLFPRFNIHETIERPNHSLQNLNCMGCLNIRKVLIPPVASWVNLSSLNLQLSVNLKEVDVACLNLNSLNLNNCYSLESLKLQCPRLNSLFIQSCNIDETFILDAISQCTMLETLDVRCCPKISATSMRKLRAACPSIERIYSSLPRL